MIASEERQFRLAQSADWERIAELDKDAIGSAARAEMIHQAILAECCYVITVGNRVAAFGILHHHFFDHGFVDLLIVGSRFRRQGIGKMLLTTLVDICRTEKLFTSTNTSNQPMQQLLHTCGFRRCGWVDELDPGDPELFYCHRRTDESVPQLEPQRVDEMAIVPLSSALLSDVGRLNQPFSVIGRAVPHLCDDQWTWSEELFAEPKEKQFPNEEIDYALYMNKADRAIFLAYAGGVCMGQIRMRRNWNGYCYIENIAVDRDYRRRGVGKRLIETAITWAKAGAMPGLMLEAQDINLNACRFYQHVGFSLGGVDTMLYANTPSQDELAMYWYMRFQELTSDNNAQLLWKIVPLDSSHHATVAAFIAERWGSSVIVSRGRAYQAADLQGFLAVAGEQLIGLATYYIEGTACEIVSLDSLREKQGIGTALIEQVISVAKEARCTRIWLITTNDNTPAVRYYQRRGFDLVALHRRAVDVSRQIKPEIPPAGLDGIPLRHELEFERLL